MTYIRSNKPKPGNKSERICIFCLTPYPAVSIGPMKFRHHDNQECIDKMWKEANKKLKQVSDREERVKKKKMKSAIKTSKDFIKELQKEINTIVRLIDKGHDCISSGRPWKPNDQAGHYKATSAAPTIRFSLLNNFSQSVADNMYKSGNLIKYTERLKEVFGQEVYEEIEGLASKHQLLKLTNSEMAEATRVARQIVKELKQADLTYTTEERLSKRREYNKRLNIYKE